MDGRRSLRPWRNELINRFNNPTENQLTFLFEDYETVASNL
ncbi:hypothetical protein DDD_2202 [Nonlabens dokdonensis DSW-6]|uniref:Uncharacterized protein n=1 Tax=Nonlabens dokdonensis (strain DSM 17205 / KCTC 12402 / DSW-6) TaxID=592029 RepID=L7WB68_NONDD|nr:hypothetical protein DDD_2202 [Nonlabens dokdonensis DSW-6]